MSDQSTHSLSNTPDAIHPADAAPILAKIIHGHVVNVRLIAGRGVTRVELEIPSEAHVPATALVHDQDVIIALANFSTPLPYGVLEAGPDGLRSLNTSARRPGQQAQQSGSAQRQGHAGVRPSSAPSTARRPGAGSTNSSGAGPRNSGGAAVHSGAIDIVRWLGARCKEEEFQLFLGARTEAGAIERVREICGVESRADIPRDRDARAVFFANIHRPFLEAVGMRTGTGGEDASDSGADVANIERVGS